MCCDRLFATPHARHVRHRWDIENSPSTWLSLRLWESKQASSSSLNDRAKFCKVEKCLFHFVSVRRRRHTQFRHWIFQNKWVAISLMQAAELNRRRHLAHNSGIDSPQILTLNIPKSYIILFEESFKRCVHDGRNACGNFLINIKRVFGWLDAVWWRRPQVT